MTNKIIIKENQLADALIVHKTVTEFNLPFDEKEFNERVGQKNNLVLVAYLNSQPIGFVISYDFQNNGSIYCWLAGVDPKYRKHGAHKLMMDYLEIWSKQQGYKNICLKTRNTRRNMLAYLVKYGYNFTGVKNQPQIEENRIFLEKKL
ncbi:GNAT family N-acetyltransferase [Patescibacteria group bacterium]|nr:GNAT family N-acetyltransferase [Patescibacteria group bacterium]MBU1891001.1 GNAT family N-acetyltransferase [Patescibacteria group bacterium]